MGGNMAVESQGFAHMLLNLPHQDLIRISLLSLFYLHPVNVERNSGLVVLVVGDTKLRDFQARRDCCRQYTHKSIETRLQCVVHTDAVKNRMRRDSGTCCFWCCFFLLVCCGKSFGVCCKPSETWRSARKRNPMEIPNSACNLI